MQDNKGISDVKTSKFRKGIPIIVVSISIAIVSLAIVVSLDDQDHKDKERESYSGDFRDYYEPWYLDFPVGRTDCFLNEDLNITVPGEMGPLVVYQHRPPKLKTIQDCEQYLAGFGFNVTGFQHRTFEVPNGHGFSKGGCDISLVIDGRYSVWYLVPSTHEWEPNISREEALDIGIAFINNHTVIPENAIVTNDTRGVGSSRYDGVKIESFIVRVQQTIDSYPIEGSGGLNSILVEVDAQTGRVQRFEYHWVTLEPIDEIGQEDLAELEDIVSGFITHYNEDAPSHYPPANSTVNVTRVEVFYRTPFEASSYKIYDDCLFYVYMPFVIIEWADGQGQSVVSPLDPEN